MAPRREEWALPSGSTARLRKTDNLELTVRALVAERRQRIGYEGMLTILSGDQPVGAPCFNLQLLHD